MMDPVAFDSRRRAIFLEKADAGMADAMLAGLRTAADAGLGIDRGLLSRIRSSFALDADAPLERAQAQGTFHRLFEIRGPDGAPRLLRIAALPGPYASRLMEMESLIVKLLRDRGLPVPACEYREIAARGAHLVERASGVSLAEIDSDEERILPALARVAQFLSRIHRIEGTQWGHLSLAALLESPARLAGIHGTWEEYVFLRLEEHLATCAASAALTEGEASEAARRFASHRDLLHGHTPALLHGDPGSPNFFVHDSEITAAIDWEDALLGDPLFDLASFCTFHPERRHATIWAAYGTEMKPGNDRWTRFWLYFLRIALAKTVHRFRFAYADKPGRAPASQRIQLALARLAQAG